MATTIDVDPADVDRAHGYNRYHSFNRYELPKPNDNWSYASTMIVGSYSNSLAPDNKYKRRSLNSRKNRNKDAGSKARPKPLQLENEKYYDLVFPKRRQNEGNDFRYVYEPNSLDHAEL